MVSQQHIPRYELQWLETHDLPPPRVRQIRTHLGGCERCSAAAAEVGAERAAFLSRTALPEAIEALLQRVAGLRQPDAPTVSFFARNPDGTIGLVTDGMLHPVGATIDVRLKPARARLTSIWTLDGVGGTRKRACWEVERSVTVHTGIQVRVGDRFRVFAFLGDALDDSAIEEWLESSLEVAGGDPAAIPSVGLVGEDVLVRSICIRGI